MFLLLLYLMLLLLLLLILMVVAVVVVVQLFISTPQFLTLNIVSLQCSEQHDLSPLEQTLVTHVSKTLSSDASGTVQI